MGKVLFLASVCALAAGAIDRFQPPPQTRILGKVPFNQQSVGYSCGAAAMQSILAYYGHAVGEEQLIKDLGSNEKMGTDHHKMAAYAMKLGIPARVASNLTLKDLADALAKEQPPIVELQAWYETKSGEPEPPKPVNYTNVWDQGHYMVLVGLDDKNAYFVDPVLPSQHGYIPLAEFVDRWHDTNYLNENLQHTAIFFDGKPNPLPPWVRVL